MFESKFVDLKARVTPYSNHKERIRITKREEEEGGKVSYDESFVYSFKS